MHKHLSFLIPLAVLMIAACTPVIGEDDVSLSIGLDGSVVLTSEVFELDLQVIFDDPEAEFAYSIDIVVSAPSGDDSVLTTLSLAGSGEHTVPLSIEEEGDFSIGAVLRNVDSDGVPIPDETVVSSTPVDVISVSEQDLSAKFQNPPQIWLLDEPFNSEIELSKELRALPLDLALQLDSSNGLVEFDRFSVAEDRETFELFSEEGYVQMRIAVLSGERELISSPAYDFEVLSSNAMVQKFFYDDRQIAQQSNGQETFDWIRDTAYPGIFNPTAEQVETLIAEFEDGQYTTTDPIWETVRENTRDFNPQPPESVKCFQVPMEWPPVPGRHFMFDYERNYTLWINGSQVGEGRDRGTRHLTFFDGRAYQWTYQC